MPVYQEFARMNGVFLPISRNFTMKIFTISGTQNSVQKNMQGKTGGRDLIADCLLMARPFKNKEIERQVAVNNFMEMILHRNIHIENCFYDDVKEIFGKDAAVTVHPTWWPYPDYNEFKKNGLDWWSVKKGLGSDR
jgi:hypothetical protein